MFLIVERMVVGVGFAEELTDRNRIKNFSDGEVKVVIE